jgi:hypothetical protein
MTNRRSKLFLSKPVVAKAAIVATCALFALPALASSPAETPCPKSEQATLIVPASELVTTTVSHDVLPVSKSSTGVSKTSLLAPRAEAAIREAFNDSEFPADQAGTAVDVELINTVLQPPAAPMAETEKADTQPEPQTGMKTQLPGIADDELSRFKKQMFRRDI